MSAAITARRRPPDNRSISLTIRAEALFASALQPSQSPSPAQVQRAIAGTLRRLGVGGCAAHLAGEMGDHPLTAAARMRWALALVHAPYPEAVDGQGGRRTSAARVAITAGVKHRNRIAAPAAVNVGVSG